MQTNLAYQFDDSTSHGDGDTPQIFNLPLTEDEAQYMLFIMEGCVMEDIEAMSIRNRLRAFFEPSVKLVIDNG